LSIATVSIDKASAKFGVIVPKKTVIELLKLLKDTRYSSSKIRIRLSTNKVEFVSDNLKVVSKLIDGQFPDYTAFIPAETSRKLLINPKLLADAIDRVAVVTAEKFRAIKLSVTTESFTLSAFDGIRGSAREVLDYSQEPKSYCEFKGTEEINIGFNPKYLNDVLSVLKEPEVEIHLGDTSSPALVKVPGSESEVFVIMPVKV
jgi:DNA polymerase-3 subunit beta